MRIGRQRLNERQLDLAVILCRVFHHLVHDENQTGAALIRIDAGQRIERPQMHIDFLSGVTQQIGEYLDVKAVVTVSGEVQHGR